MDEWVKVCDTCGNVGREDLLAFCKKCTDGAQHTYCMCVKLEKVPGNWTWICEECMPREGTYTLKQDNAEKSARRMKGYLFESPINRESIQSSKKLCSPYDWKSRTNGVSSTDRLKLKRYGDPLKDPLMKKARANETSYVAPNSLKPCNNSLDRMNFTGEVKTKLLNNIVYSSPQRSCDYQLKETTSNACGNRGHVKSLFKRDKIPYEDQQVKKVRDIETSFVSPSSSKHVKCVARRHRGPLEDQQVKKDRAIETSFVAPSSSKPCNNTPLHKGFSAKLKTKSLNNIIYSPPPRSCDYQDKEKASQTCGNREYIKSFAKLRNNGCSCETIVVSPKDTNPQNHSTVGRIPSSNKSRKLKLEDASSLAFPKPTSHDVVKKKMLPYCNHENKGNAPHKSGVRECMRSFTKLGKSERTHETRNLSPKASNSLNPSTLGKKPPSKKTGKGKFKAVVSVTHPKLSSYRTGKKEVLPHCCGDGSPKLEDASSLASPKPTSHGVVKMKMLPYCTHENKGNAPHKSGVRECMRSFTKLGKSERTHETRNLSPKASNSLNPSTLGKKPPSKNSGKGKFEAAVSVTPPKLSSYNIGKKELLPYCCGDGSPQLENASSLSSPKPTSHDVVKKKMLPYFNHENKGNAPHKSGVRECMRSCTELGKSERTHETRNLSPKASNSLNPSSLGKKPSSKKLGKGKFEAAVSAIPPKLSSYNTGKKEVLPNCCGDGSPKLGSQTKMALDEYSLLMSSSFSVENLKAKVIFSKAGCLQKQKFGRNLDCHDDRKGKGPKLVSADSMSLNSLISEKSNTTSTCSQVLPVSAYGLNNSAMFLLTSDSVVNARKPGKETILGGDSLFSGSSFCDVDAVESLEKLDHRLQASNHTYKDSDCPKEKKQNESQQAKDPIEATTAKMTDPAFDEWSRLADIARIEAEILSLGHLMPEIHYSWIGKFQIHSCEGVARTCDGFQAHLSTCHSVKTLDFVYSLPEIIILEELPRSKIWPSRFMGAQLTKKNIGLYFFAKDVNSYITYYRGLMNCMTNNDLALKGNLDGAELLIFPSNILPKEIQRWNNLLFFWGVFEERKANNSTNSIIL